MGRGEEGRRGKGKRGRGGREEGDWTNVCIFRFVVRDTIEYTKFVEQKEEEDIVEEGKLGWREGGREGEAKERREEEGEGGEENGEEKGEGGEREARM